MRKALNESVLPLLKERGFTGKFPLVVRQRAMLTDSIALQCDRYGGGIILHLYCSDAQACPASSMRIGKAFETKPIRGATVSPRLFEPNAPYWFRYQTGEEHLLSGRMREWVAAIDGWFISGVWERNVFPESFRPKLGKQSLIRKLFSLFKN